MLYPFLELDKRRDRRATLSEAKRKREIERERERDREKGYGNLGGPTTPNQEPHRLLHRYGSPGPILPPAPNIARYSSSAVPNAGLGASADRTIDLIGTPPERESTWARHAAQRTKGTNNKPRVSASSGANAGASVNASSLNANVVEDWGGGVTSPRARGTGSARGIIPL